MRVDIKPIAGGPTEKVRAEELMSRLTIIPDQESNKIKVLQGNIIQNIMIGGGGGGGG